VLYFEDMEKGRRLSLGSRTLTRDEIVRFAREFDPQHFHLEDDGSPYGGIIASGWHTCAIVQRLAVDGFVRDIASQGSPGIDSIRWLKPVRPGDRLDVSVEITDAVPSRSRPDRGTITVRYTVTNQRGETVLVFEGAGLIGRRPA
jgi:acyl dehydratase